ncbi:hypothetical protein BJ912DRAFT_1051955 [Pholiota molesta]|nr:hypothetical protein BJ912DRAFT_1051955 [Pholiota molesta]
MPAAPQNNKAKHENNDCTGLSATSPPFHHHRPSPPPPVPAFARRPSTSPPFIMELDASDILGQPSMPAARPARHGIFSLTPAQYVCVPPLATRRRHGIPDNDLRPFNVAYSEAAMKAREEENQLKPRPIRPQASVVDLREASQDHIVRNRSGAKKVLTRHRGYLNIIEDAEGSDKKRSFDEDMVDDEHEAKAKKTRLEGDDQLMDEDEPPLQRGSKRGARDQDVEEDEEDGLSTSKASRGKRARKVSQADSSMDVDAYDEEADEVADLRSFETARGKKRDRAEAGSTFGGDDDEEEAGSAAEFEDDKARRRRRKRRTVAKRKSEASYARGKKRDREGSGEASDHQLSGESSPGRRANLSRTKKRGKRGSLAPGQAQALLRHRGEGEADAVSDVSMDGGESVSTSVRMRGRNVGDEWESNGVRYKIGPNFQRLRQALVKKARQKFVMPKDSQHPDRDANLQVCIETWLTEEEYQEAKAQHMLAWQDESPPPAPSEHPEKLTLDILSTQKTPKESSLGQLNYNYPHSLTCATLATLRSRCPTTTGVATPTHAPATRQGKNYRHSIATSAGLPISPFYTSQIPTAKRIASTSRALSLAASVSGSPADSGAGAVPSSPGLSDSTNVGGAASPRTMKVFSKWEKQELEARAMMKIREANRKKEMEHEAKLKEERERNERERNERAERERQERARQEREARERAEKERQERERQEKERKEKEAQQQKAAAVTAPQITVTAPSTGPLVLLQCLQLRVITIRRPEDRNQARCFYNVGVLIRPFDKQRYFKCCSNKTVLVRRCSSSGGTEQPKKDESAAPAAPSSGSLLTRMGAQAPSAPASNEPPKPAASSSNAFSFNAPKQEGAPSTSSPFGAPTSTSEFQQEHYWRRCHKHEYRAAPAPSPFGAPSSSSLSGALGPDANKAASAATSSPFGGFKTPGAPASATNGSNGSTSTTSAPIKFNFSGPSVFGGGSTAMANLPSLRSEAPRALPRVIDARCGSSTAAASTPASGPSSSPFSFNFGSTPTPGATSTTPASSPFGAPAGSSTQSAFGTSNAPSVFGGGAFGSTANQQK